MLQTIYSTDTTYFFKIHWSQNVLNKFSKCEALINLRPIQPNVEQTATKHWQRYKLPVIGRVLLSKMGANDSVLSEQVSITYNLC